MSLERRASAWRAQRRRVLLSEALARALGWGAAYAGLLTAADRLASLPQSARAAAWAAGLAGLLVHVWRGAVAPWRAAGWEEIFREAARRWPETGAMFAPAWALRADPGGRDVSSELRGEHLARCDRLAESLPEAPLFEWTPSRAARTGGAAGALALACCLALGARGSWTRVLAPWLDSPLDRLVVLLPGDAGVDWGASVRLSARLTPEGVQAGLRAADLALETRGSEGGWHPVPWDAVDAASASFETGALAGPLDYRARYRDLTSGVRRLRALLPPRFKTATAVVHSARGTRTFVLGRDAPVRARRGDWITIRGEADAPLSSAVLRLTSLPSPVAMRASGSSWSGGFLAQEDATLTPELTAADGRRDSAPPAYAVSVLGDAKPVAELLSPQVPLQAGPRDALTIAYAARDDGALTRLELVIRAPKGETRRALAIERDSAETLGDALLALRDFAPGSVVEFWLEASDDASPPQSVRSLKGSVEIVDVDAAHTGALAAREKALAALERAAAAAERAANAAASGNEESARESAKPVEGLWVAAAGALMAWNEAMRDDPRSNPGLAEQAAAAADNLAAAGMEGMPKAAEALKSGDLARAAREQKALAEQARAAAAALREGARVQNAQDMADRAHDAQTQGRELERALEGLEDRMSPEQAEELKRALASVDAALAELRSSIDALPEASAETSAVRELPLDGAREAASALRDALRRGDPAAAAKAARELAERLSRLSKGLRESGRRVADAQARRAQEQAGRVARAWKEAVSAQEKAVDAARRRVDAGLAERVRAQKALLLRARDAIDSSLATGVTPDSERSLRAARDFLEAGRAEQTVTLLRAAAGRERQASLTERARASALEAGAKSLDEAAASLERGVGAPAPNPGAAREAASAQALARESAARLRTAVTEAADQLGFTAGGPLRRVDDALAEQAAAESSLRRGDAPEGLRRGEAALTILQDGDQSSSGGESQAGGMGEAMSRPFDLPGGVVRSAPRGSRGTGIGRVRLPSADDYRPPRELREELERSLREPRPAAQDSAIKEYFRRLAR